MIGIGSDHLGFALKEDVRAFVEHHGTTVLDFGAFCEDPVDYPDIALRVADAVRLGLLERAVLVCGTGLGMAIVANKVPGVRAAPVSSVELAVAARRSNDAQIIPLGASVVSPEQACAIVHAWLSAQFRGGDSARKLAKIGTVERRYRVVAVYGSAPAAATIGATATAAAAELALRIGGR
ncbi:MAG: RpiB/LacA/LacB family sugar-phosphate isomerase [Armatimonadota bacterium]